MADLISGTAIELEARTEGRQIAAQSLDHSLSAPPRSPWTIFLRRLKRNRTAMFGLYLLAVLYFCAVFAGPLAPYKYDNTATRSGFHPPMLNRIHIFDEAGRLTRPFIYGLDVVDQSLKLYEEDKTTRYPIRFFVRGDDYTMLWVLRWNVHLFGVDDPARIYLLGSDQFGRDILSRLLYGAQISLSIGILGILISTTVGMLIGGIAGYFGGALDFGLMRSVEVLLALPSLYFILMLRYMFGSRADSTYVYLVMVVILGLIGSASEARVIRGMVLSIREREYILAARALGLSHARIILRHVLPNTLSFVIVTATLFVPFYILGEVALSYLSVGIQEPEASWGNMLSNAQNVRNFVDFPWTLTPGIFIFIAVMAWNFVGDGLRDAADPRTTN